MFVEFCWGRADVEDSDDEGDDCFALNGRDVTTRLSQMRREMLILLKIRIKTTECLAKKEF